MAGVPPEDGPVAPAPSPPAAVPGEDQMLISVDAGLDAPSIYEIFPDGTYVPQPQSQRAKLSAAAAALVSRALAPPSNGGGNGGGGGARAPSARGSAAADLPPGAGPPTSGGAAKPALATPATSAAEGSSDPDWPATAATALETALAELSRAVDVIDALRAPDRPALTLKRVAAVAGIAAGGSGGAGLPGALAGGDVNLGAIKTSIAAAGAAAAGKRRSLAAAAATLRGRVAAFRAWAAEDNTYISGVLTVRRGAGAFRRDTSGRLPMVDVGDGDFRPLVKRPLPALMAVRVPPPVRLHVAVTRADQRVGSADPDGARDSFLFPLPSERNAARPWPAETVGFLVPGGASGPDPSRAPTAGAAAAAVSPATGSSPPAVVAAADMIAAIRRARLAAFQRLTFERMLREAAAATTSSSSANAAGALRTVQITATTAAVDCGWNHVLVFARTRYPFVPDGVVNYLAPGTTGANSNGGAPGSTTSGPLSGVATPVVAGAGTATSGRQAPPGSSAEATTAASPGRRPRVTRGVGAGQGIFAATAAADATVLEVVALASSARATVALSATAGPESPSQANKATYVAATSVLPRVVAAAASRAAARALERAVDDAAAALRLTVEWTRSMAHPDELRARVTACAIDGDGPTRFLATFDAMGLPPPSAAAAPPSPPDPAIGAAPPGAGHIRATPAFGVIVALPEDVGGRGRGRAFSSAGTGAAPRDDYREAGHAGGGAPGATAAADPTAASYAAITAGGLDDVPRSYIMPAVGGEVRSLLGLLASVRLLDAMEMAARTTPHAELDVDRQGFCVVVIAPRTPRVLRARVWPHARKVPWSELAVSPDAATRGLAADYAEATRSGIPASAATWWARPDSGAAELPVSLVWLDGKRVTGFPVVSSGRLEPWKRLLRQLTGVVLPPEAVAAAAAAAASARPPGPRPDARALHAAMSPLGGQPGGLPGGGGRGGGVASGTNGPAASGEGAGVPMAGVRPATGAAASMFNTGATANGPAVDYGLGFGAPPPRGGGGANGMG
ncbi:hypothetical protein MMPV_003110 [Pyropia vietnamensis]